MYKNGCIVVALLIALVAPASAATDSFPSTNILLWGRYTVGQVVSSISETGSYDFDFNREWLENFEGGIRLNRQLSPRLCGRFHIGFGANVATVRQSNFLTAELTARRFVAALLDASMLYSYSGVVTSSDSLQIEMGYFPFKYNPQAQNLGEYLFRSGVYPAVLVSGFEHANNDRPKIGGVHLGYGIPFGGSLKLDLMLNSELEMYPLRDLHVTGIAAYSPHRVLTLGAGVQWMHLISLDDRKTTPGNYQAVNQWTGYIDTAAKDTTIYTFSGTKLMGRATLDLKAALEELTGPIAFFGKEDLKVYGEAAVLGVKNYKGWYANRNERIPLMAGINWPTHQFASYAVVPGVMGYLLEQKKAEREVLGMHLQENVIKAGVFGLGGIIVGVASWVLDQTFNTSTRLDLLSIEAEYYGSKYWNSQEFMWKSRSPVPYIGITTGLDYSRWNDSIMAKTDDDWKWSVYAAKRIGTRLKVSGQAACDHTPRNWYTPGPPSFVKYTEMVPRSQDWYWMLRATFYF